MNACLATLLQIFCKITLLLISLEKIGLPNQKCNYLFYFFFFLFCIVDLWAILAYPEKISNRHWVNKTKNLDNGNNTDSINVEKGDGRVWFLTLFPNYSSTKRHISSKSEISISCHCRLPFQIYYSVPQKFCWFLAKFPNLIRRM